MQVRSLVNVGSIGFTQPIAPVSALLNGRENGGCRRRTTKLFSFSISPKDGPRRRIRSLLEQWALKTWRGELSKIVDLNTTFLSNSERCTKRGISDSTNKAALARDAI
jgi:hypothetical protein